ncbi:MAG: hypothetical protein AAF752_04490 [Bacteroidota bacterium]
MMSPHRVLCAAHTLLAGFVVLSLAACGTSSPLADTGADQFHQLPALIKLDQGPALDAVSPYIEADSLHWTDPRTGRFLALPLTEVRSIEFVDTYAGGWGGLWIGGLAGVSTAALITIVSTRATGETDDILPESMQIGGVMGAFFGWLTGRQVGYRYRLAEVPAPVNARPGSDDIP